VVRCVRGAECGGPWTWGVAQQARLDLGC
jgi:hypothetical protein